jgi:hypothetical protein
MALPPLARRDRRDLDHVGQAPRDGGAGRRSLLGAARADEGGGAISHGLPLCFITEMRVDIRMDP